MPSVPSIARRTMSRRAASPSAPKMRSWSSETCIDTTIRLYIMSVKPSGLRRVLPACGALTVAADESASTGDVDAFPLHHEADAGASHRQRHVPLYRHRGLHQAAARAGHRYADALAEHRRLLREAFSAHDGAEVDTQGDACFAAFARPSDAVTAAEQGRLALDSTD